jgi:hypothetical protein
MKEAAGRKARDQSTGKRASRRESEVRRTKEMTGDHAARLIADLEAQKTRYERFFESLGPDVIDNQATYAYTSLVKAIADVRKRAAEKPDLYAMVPTVMEEFVKFIKAEGTEKDKAMREEVFDLIDCFFEETMPK